MTFLSFWSFPRPSEPFGIHQGRTVIFSKILVVTYSYAYENLRFTATSFHHYFRKRKIWGSLLSQVIAKSVKWMWKTSSLKTKCFFFSDGKDHSRTYKRDLTLNKDAEFSKTMFSTKLVATSVYKFIMIIRELKNHDEVHDDDVLWLGKDWNENVSLGGIKET